MHLRFAFALAMLTSAAALSAQGGSAEPHSPEYAGCLTRAGSSTVQQGMCSQAELTRQDARLNRAYQGLMTFYGRAGMPGAGDRATMLREEERAWLADRDQTCRVNHETVDTDCLVRRETARADELEARLRGLT